MAAPAEMTTLDISGKFIMVRNAHLLFATTVSTEKSLSDSTDDILRLQGPPVEHIDIDQTTSGGMSGTTEHRVLDNEERESSDYVFGAVKGRSRRLRLDELDNEFLRQGWLDDVGEHGTVWTRAMSDTPKSGTSWTAEQTWGFEDINGERRYARHVNFTGPKEEKIQARLVYDYRE
ncbi:hypothetical protein B0H21DRAFT_723399 [Amylocystis lapponica]|nr:hypothetical protein B0H21DRAFT_723399 [Amylocystis lapponica]